MSERPRYPGLVVGALLVNPSRVHIHAPEADQASGGAASQNAHSDECA
jgi:hypothetical protein